MKYEQEIFVVYIIPISRTENISHQTLSVNLHVSLTPTMYIINTSPYKSFPVLSAG